MSKHSKTPSEPSPPDSASASYEPNELSASDPLERLDAILENEDFAGERISYVTLESAPEKRNTQFDALRKRYPKAFGLLVAAVACVAWAKTMYEAWELLR